VDEVILPHQTRYRLIRARAVCANKPELEAFKVGVFQV
jgi:acetyl-CoA carboxylase carboxyltransferase component